MAGTTTGLAPLADIGKLAYNGVQFSSLYRSKLEGKVIADESGRATQMMEYMLTVDGTVTLETGQKTIDATWAGLRQKLTVHGGQLTYQNKGFGTLAVLGGTLGQDVAWGPVPEILHFQPLGADAATGTKAANITWRVTTRVADMKVQAAVPVPQGVPLFVPNLPGPVLQFSYEYQLTYDDRCYAGATLKGTLEIPLTRNPAGSRAISSTVDDFRQAWLNVPVDLTRYKVVHRDFQESRDKRKCEWVYQLQELTPAGLPIGSSRAKGKMSVRNLPAGGKGGVRILATPRWGQTLTCTYTIRRDFPRRIALFSFLSLLWYRMWSVEAGGLQTGVTVVGPNGQQVSVNQAVGQILQNQLINAPPPPRPLGAKGALDFYTQLAKNMNQAGKAALVFLHAGAGPGAAKGADEAFAGAMPLLMDFSVEEGLYEDADTISFQASWYMFTTFQTLLSATGVWQYNQDTGGDAWAASMQDVMGWRGPAAARIDPSAEVIVDMGGGQPLSGSPILAE